MKSTSTFILGILLSVFATYTQAQEENSLLWKIEGKGLQDPSYIYGTIHVHDDRVFNFSDSVFIAIESCDAFALEVHPDSAIMAMITKVQEHFDNAYYEDLLSDEEMERLKKHFKKINGYEFDELEDKNPLTVQNLLEPSYEKPDDRQTFMDAYLYSSARSMNKEILGLENHHEQMDQIMGLSTSERKNMIMEYVDFPEELAKSMREQMVELYATGDLSKIKDFIGSSIFSDSLFILRNEVMTNSIIDVIHTKSLFSAVGAAHLVGDISVVQMLKNRGYEVTPVTQVYTGIADQYIPDLSKIPWETYTDSLTGLTLKVPNVLNELTVEFSTMNMSLDLVTESAYAFMSFDNRNEPDSIDIVKIMEEYETNLKESNNEILAKKTLETENGTIGDFLVEQEKNQHYRTQIIKKNGFVHYFFIWSKKDFLYSPSSEKFFESISFFQPKAPKPGKGWFTYADSTNAFSVQLPSFPESRVQEHPNPDMPEGDMYKVNLLFSMDMPNFTNYIVAFNDLPRGMYMEDSNMALDLLIQELEQSGTEITDVKNIELQGVPGRELYCILEGGYHCKLKIFQRGNRTYKFLKQNIKENDNRFIKDNFLTSISFLSYQEAEFVKQNSVFDKESFIELPNTLETFSDSIDYTAYYDDAYTSYSKNLNTGGMYQIEMYRLNEYFCIENLDSFYFENGSLHRGWNDTLVYEKIVAVNDRKRYESVMGYKGSTIFTRYQNWIHNDIYYTIAIFGNNEEIYSDAANTFFNGFNDNNGGQPIDYYASKAKKIIDNLNSQDSISYKKAEGALTSYYTFRIEDLPELRRGLSLSFSDDSKSYGTKSYLIDALASLKSEESLDPLADAYNASNATSAIQESILIALTNINSSNSIQLYLDLLFSNPPDSLNSDWITFYPFIDSMALFKGNVTNLMNLYEKDGYQKSVLSTIAYALTANKDSLAKVVEPYFEQLTETAIEELKEFINQKASDPTTYSYNTNIHHYLSLMEHITGKSITDEYTQLYVQQDSSFHTDASAMTVRIKNDLEIDMTYRNQLIDSLHYRASIFNAYKEIHTIDKFPSKYLTPVELVKMVLLENLMVEEYYPDAIDYLDELTFNENQYLVFKFSQSYEDFEYSYLAVARYEENDSPAAIYDSTILYLDWSEFVDDWQDLAIKMISE
ncbi:MAG: TraB/GumN family protein [Bacteroidota bacterium]